MKILILCTGNSCRSQMAEMFLKSLDNRLNVVSAGTNPSPNIHLKTILVMKEIGFDLSNSQTKSVNVFLKENFDYLITVCGGAKENCPVFNGNVKQTLHIGFDDPAEVKGTEDYIISEFKRVRNEIKIKITEFYKQEIMLKL
ncbi:MAG: arsenate reductase ArsC [Bacteroidales bacterium]|nr:arsenate reductase ArsC [Bacteroidales bacterium]